MTVRRFFCSSRYWKRSCPGRSWRRLTIFSRRRRIVGSSRYPALPLNWNRRVRRSRARPILQRRQIRMNRSSCIFGVADPDQRLLEELPTAATTFVLLSESSRRVAGDPVADTGRRARTAPCGRTWSRRGRCSSARDSGYCFLPGRRAGGLQVRVRIGEIHTSPAPAESPARECAQSAGSVTALPEGRG